MEPEGGRLCRASAAVRCALPLLLSCALLASLVALAALLLPPPAQGGAQGGTGAHPGPGPAPTAPPSLPPSRSLLQGGVRLVLRGPGKILKPGKLEWYTDNRMDGVHLGPGFEYNSESHMLKIKNHGLYYIYAQLSAVHLSKSSCKEAGIATLTVHRKTSHGVVPILTLPLHLSASSSKSLVAFTAVSPYQLAEGSFLYVTLTVSNPVEAGQCKSTQWYFGEGTVFGLSPTSGNCNSEATGISGCSPDAQEVEWILKDLGKFFQRNA